MRCKSKRLHRPVTLLRTVVVQNLFAFLASWRFGLCFVLLFTVSCSSAPSRQDTVTIAIEAGPNNLDPRIGLSSESERIHQLLFNSLVRRGAHFEILPDLAERWETPDPTTYRFVLRSGVRFHDGKALSSRDVRYTLQSLLDGLITSPKTSTYRVIERIETLMTEPSYSG